MEKVIDRLLPSSINWLDARYRALVFSVLSKINYGQLEIVEGDKHYFFPERITQSDHESIAGADTDNPVIRAKLIVHDSKMYGQFVKGGSIGAAEAFIDGMWSSPDLTAIIRIFARAQQQTDKLEKNKTWLNKFKNSFLHWQNRNSQSGSKRNILAHYDLGNELYTRFLDPQMMYSSAIYPSEEATLEQAQLHKMNTICQRLALNENDHLLEIGTGWGGLAIFAAQKYGCKVTTTTISDEQFNYAKAKIESLGLTEQITLLKEDYRDLTGKFDKLVSVEMIEAVGFEYLPSFFNQCNDRLKEGGKLLIQSITIADQRFEYYKNNVDFIQRYIFPGGFLPSINVLSENLTKHTSLVMESIDDIGLDYAKTLADWRTAFNASWQELSTLGYDDTFKRLWLYYFGYCEGAFLERSISTVHIVARK